jgi:hypothetical protein
LRRGVLPLPAGPGGISHLFIYCAGIYRREGFSPMCAETGEGKISGPGGGNAGVTEVYTQHLHNTASKAHSQMHVLYTHLYVPGTTDADKCATACCAKGELCDAWQFPTNPSSFAFPNGCWIGIGTTKTASNPAWCGRAWRGDKGRHLRCSW